MGEACRDLRKTRLVILGVIHRETGGRDQLAKWLHAVDPDVVTIELTRYGIDFRRRHGPSLKQRIQSVAEELERTRGAVNTEALGYLLSFLEIPFEYEEVESFCGSRGRKFYLLDMDLFSHARLRTIDEIFDDGNVRRLLASGDAFPVNQKRRALMYFQRGIKTHDYTEEMYIRDLHMSRKLAVLMEHGRDKRFLHITGWQHLVDPHQLYGGMNPLKVFIYDTAYRL